MTFFSGTSSRAVAAAGAVTLLLTGCSVANSEESSPQDAVRIILPVEPPTLEPCHAASTATGVVVRSNITEPLIERDPSSGELRPLLASSWEPTGEKEWTFTLREGVTFQDGTAFNAQAAAHSINRVLTSSLSCSAKTQMFGNAKVEVQVVGDKTVKVTSETADPLMPLRISYVEMVPASTDVNTAVVQPVGTGPYKIKQWDAGTKLVLERNDTYWGDAPTFAAAEYQWRAESTVRAAMITSGEADIAMALSPDDGLGELGIAYPNNETVALRLGGEIAPLDDIRIRQAIAYAIDRDGIAKSLYPGIGKPAADLIPPGTVGSTPDKKPFAFDLDKAKQLVADAKADGVPVDLPITLVGRNAQFPKVSELAQVLRDELAQVGLNVQLRMVETATHQQYQRRPGVTDQGAIALLVQHGNQSGDASFTTNSNFTTTAVNGAMGTAEFDAMIQAAAAKSGDERQKAYQDIFKFHDDKINQFAPIMHMSSVIGKAESVDYTPNAASGDELHVADIKPGGK